MHLLYKYPSSWMLMNGFLLISFPILWKCIHVCNLLISSYLLVVQIATLQCILKVTDTTFNLKKRVNMNVTFHQNWRHISPKLTFHYYYDVYHWDVYSLYNNVYKQGFWKTLFMILNRSFKSNMSWCVCSYLVSFYIPVPLIWRF